MSGLIIGHNLGAMSALSALNANSNALNNALEQLSTGKRINSAADDASGYAISQKMQAQINGLNQASQNAQDGISMIQTASGALNQTLSILQTMRQLAVEASNSTTTQSDRQDLQAEFNQLADQINNIANTTQYNTQNLLDGSLSGESANITQKGTVLTNASISSVFGLTQGATYTIKVTQGTNGAPDQAQLVDSSGNVIASGNITSGGTVVLASNNANAGNTQGIVLNAGSYTWGSSTSDQIQFTVQQGNSITLQIGANTTQTINVGINGMSAAALGITGQAGASAGGGAQFSASDNVNNGTNGPNTEAALDISSNVAYADAAIQVIDNAIQTVSTVQANLGAVQNRLQTTISNLNNASQNLTTAQSGITDADMASEMAQFTQDSVLQQAAVAMLAQANQQPQLVLKLLG